MSRLTWIAVALGALSAFGCDRQKAGQPKPAVERGAPPSFDEEHKDPEAFSAEKRYLDSRTGAALERTAKNLISQSSYRCDKIRAIERMEADVLSRVSAEDGRWVDCGDDGIYGVLEVPGGFKVVKR